MVPKGARLRSGVGRLQPVSRRKLAPLLDKPAHASPTDAERSLRGAPFDRGIFGATNPRRSARRAPLVRLGPQGSAGDRGAARTDVAAREKPSNARRYGPSRTAPCNAETSRPMSSLTYDDQAICGRTRD